MTRAIDEAAGLPTRFMQLLEELKTEHELEVLASNGPKYRTKRISLEPACPTLPSSQVDHASRSFAPHPPPLTPKAVTPKSNAAADTPYSVRSNDSISLLRADSHTETVAQLHGNLAVLFELDLDHAKDNEAAHGRQPRVGRLVIAFCLLFFSLFGAVVTIAFAVVRPLTKNVFVADSLLMEMNDVDFRRFLAFVYWITSIITGFGSEIVVGHFLTMGADTQHLVPLWAFAEFIFPVCATVSFQAAASQSFFFMPFMIIGLWKLGFPETFHHISFAIAKHFWRDLEAFAHLLEGVGMMLHHSSAALCCCLLCAGVEQVTRGITSCIAYLIMQHWFVMIRDQHYILYAMVELILETGFEWEVLANMRDFMEMDWTVSLSFMGMLIAHWCYLSSAGLRMIVKLYNAACSASPHDAPRRIPSIIGH